MTNKKNPLDNPLNLTLLSLVAGLILAFISSFLTADPAILLLIGISGLILGLQFSELRVTSQVTPKLAKLEQALDHPILFDLFEEAIDAHQKLDGIVKAHPQAAEFFEEKLQHLCATSDLEWRELGDGRIIMNDEERELNWGAEILSLAQNHVYAVAYGDEDFWKKREGRNYLDEHVRLKARGVQLIRIFVLDKERLQDQRPIILEQIQKGVRAFIIPPEEIKLGDREDFVLYDGYYVRYAKQVYEYKKRATLSIEPNDLRKYVNKFENLKRRSVLAEEFFADFRNVI